jgi:hypothetical protein
MEKILFLTERCKSEQNAREWLGRDEWHRYLFEKIRLGNKE